MATTNAAVRAPSGHRSAEHTLPGTPGTPERHRPVQADWDQTLPCNPGKSLDLSFLLDMTGPVCYSARVDTWGMAHHCIRNADHGGRHVAVHKRYGYVLAVWA
jgi:hypothetical protein